MNIAVSEDLEGAEDAKGRKKITVFFSNLAVLRLSSVPSLGNSQNLQEQHGDFRLGCVGLWEMCENQLLNAPSSALAAPHHSFNSPTALQEAPWSGKSISTNTLKFREHWEGSCLLVSGQSGYGGDVLCHGLLQISREEKTAATYHIPRGWAGWCPVHLTCDLISASGAMALASSVWEEVAEV